VMLESGKEVFMLIFATWKGTERVFALFLVFVERCEWFLICF